MYSLGNLGGLPRTVRLGERVTLILQYTTPLSMISSVTLGTGESPMSMAVDGAAICAEMATKMIRKSLGLLEAMEP